MKTINYFKVVLPLLIIALLCGTWSFNANAQTSGNESTVPFSATGTIAYSKTMGGYYFLSKDPFGDFMIVNKDQQVLDKFLKSGKVISIKGRLRGGAEFLIIEKIDGHPYLGAK